jgi:hypothetical protein
VHHSWIAEFLMIATFAHKAIFLIRDYSNKGLDVIGRILAHKASILSHLSWICLWLGLTLPALMVIQHLELMIYLFGLPYFLVLI